MKIELLAPAGSYEALTAAIQAGADAVYLGGERFGARAYARNLTKEEMIEAIDYVHLHGKKLYLTVNTLLKNREMERELYQYLEPYYEAGLDAVIVQDLGVMRFIKRHFPGLPIHASTQMTITGPESAKLLKEAGASRVVTARELSLKEIRQIYDTTHMEIESFVHGALCYCYSGQCLMSSMIGGRSGNRGRCAQPCRLPYQVYREGKRKNDEKTSYVLSPKDMCTVRILPEILEAGVHSLKIEGRMKKPEYTAGVVEIYRKYLDRYLAGEKRPDVSQEDYQTLLDIYNRDGFHESYYKVRNGREMMALRNEKKSITGEEKKNIRNEELFARIRREYLETKKQEKIKGTLSLFSDCPAILEAEYHDIRVMVEGAVVQEAQNRPLEEERVRRQMEKTGETEFTFEKLDIYMGDTIFLPMQQLNELRRKALEALKEEILTPYRRKPFSAEKNELTGQRKTGFGNSPVLTASVETKEQLRVVLRQTGLSRIYADCGMFSPAEFSKQVKEVLSVCQVQDKELWLTLPRMVRDRECDSRKPYFEELIREGLAGFLVRNLESYGILKGMHLEKYCRLDSNMYTMNDEAKAYWQEQEIAGDTAPLELNKRELAHRKNENSEMIIYGYAPMMVSAQCVQKNLDRCDKSCAKLTLKDRYQKDFSVVCSCEFCYNTIYNSLPLSLLKEREEVWELGFEGLRLSFTLEDEVQTEQILRIFQQVYLEGRQAPETFPIREVTRGHFGRGVE